MDLIRAASRHKDPEPTVSAPAHMTQVQRARVDWSSAVDKSEPEKIAMRNPHSLRGSVSA